MDFITDEFIFARTGEPLEARLRKSERFKGQVQSLHKASKAFSEDSSLSKKDWKLYDRLESEWTNITVRMERNLTVWALKMAYSWQKSVR